MLMWIHFEHFAWHFKINYSGIFNKNLIITIFTVFCQWKAEFTGDTFYQDLYHETSGSTLFVFENDDPTHDPDVQNCCKDQQNYCMQFAANHYLPIRIYCRPRTVYKQCIGSMLRPIPTDTLYTVQKLIDFSRFNTKCSGKRDIAQNISCSISFSYTFRVLFRKF